MKKFLTQGILILAIAVLPNLCVGILRMNAGDRIAYAINHDKSYITSEQKLVETPFHLSPAYSVADMSRLPVWKDSILRSDDAFGFSNIVENKSPEILFTGDSYLNDPHFSTTEGIQASVNKRFQKNIAYNLGKFECAGFKVYNELTDQYFTKKPALLVFEVVERNAYDVITNAPAELRKHTFKSMPYKNFYADLLFANNFKDISKSRLFNKATPPPAPGTERLISGKKVWFLNNQLTELTETGIRMMVDSMKAIDSILQRQQVHIVFVIGPDKESTYPGIFGASYLKLLQAKMKEAQINFIDMHTALEGNGMRYYYDGDTHWNKEAIDFLGGAAAEKYKSLLAERK